MKWFPALVAALVLLWVGLMLGHAGRDRVAAPTTVSAAAPAAPASDLLPVDPSLTTDCTPEPDQPPVCTQGNYRVQPPVLGSVCGSGNVWEWNQQYMGLGGRPYTAVCARPDPSHLPG